MKAFTIAGNELRRYSRDKTALFFTIAFPFLLILLIGTLTAGFDDQVFKIGVVQNGSGALTSELRHDLEAQPRIELVSYDDRLSLAKDVRRAAVPAGIVIPRDYDATLLAGKTASVELVLDQTRGQPAAVRSLVAGVIADRAAIVQAAVFAHERSGVPIRKALAEAREAKKLTGTVAVGVRAKTVGEPETNAYLPPGIGYQAPSNLVLFVFISSLTGSALLIQSRQLRVIQRMFATPTSTRQILMGQALARFGIASFQALFIYLVGAFVFDVDWGQPLGAFALIITFVIVGTGVGMLMGTVFSTPEQAGAIGSMIGVSMGMLGGCMWPLEIVPKPMQTLGHLFPHAWAMDAWIELIGKGGTIADILPNLAVLGAFAVVLLPLGMWRLRRALVAGA